MKKATTYAIISVIVIIFLSGLFLFEKSTTSRYLPRSRQYKEIDGAITWLNERRLNLITHSIDIKDITNAQQKVLQLKNSSKSGLNLEWTEMGPDNIGGRTRALLIDKNNTTILYAGGVAGGLWKSTTAGITWQKVNDNFENLAIVSICQSANGDIYFGTGEGMYSNSGSGSGGIQGQGIWKSVDGNIFTRLSSTWSTTSQQTIFVNVNKMAADPFNNDRIYAATRRGLMVSSDGGQSWSNATNSTSESSDVKVASDGTVIASIGNRPYLSDNGNPGTFVKSPNASNQISSYANRLEFAFAPSDPNYIYCQSAQNNTTVIYQSVDKGQTWSIIRSGLLVESFNPLGSQGTYNNAIAVYPDNKEKILIGGQLSLWKGQGYNNNWDFEPKTWWNLHPSSSQYLHADQHVIVFHPNDPSKIYIGCDGGLFRSLDGGSTFHSLNNNYNVTQFYSVAFSANGNLAGGTQDNGSLFIDTYAITSKSARELTGGDGGYTEFSMLDPDIAFTTIYYGDVFLNRVGHSSDQVFNSNTGGSFVTPIALWESRYDTYSTDSITFKANKDYYAEDTIVLVSKYQNLTIDLVLTQDLQKNDSLKIQDYYQGLLAVGVNGGIVLSRNVAYKSYMADWLQPINVSGTVTTLAFSGNGDHLYFAVGNTLYRASNILQARDAAGYAQITKNQIGSFSQTITGIAVDPQDENNVVVTLGNYGYTNYIYFSDNAAVANTTSGNFSPKQGNLPAMPVYSATFDWNNSDIVIIGTEYGIYSTQNISSSPPTWSDESNGMPNVPVFMVRQQHLDNFWAIGNTGVQNHGYLYAATHGRGIFKCESLKGPVAIKEQVHINQKQDFIIYPNPVNNYAQILFNQPLKSNIVLKIININGNIIKTEKIRTNFQDQFSFNTQDLAPGTYFINIISGQDTYTKKFIVLK